MQTLRTTSAPCLTATCAGSGPCVILLHGIGGNRSNWNDQVEFLAFFDLRKGVGPVPTNGRGDNAELHLVAGRAFAILAKRTNDADRIRNV